ncbi:hypothetical protein HQ533_05285 [Candidatus Woesearchaeota archaeon]|nr:hypothetical protein [Candidatus Woesearchaeota archaeon]
MVNLADRRREWLENLAELRRKKEKELNDLEEKKKKELKEAEEMLQAGAEELSAEEEEILEQLRQEIPALREIEEEKAEKEEQAEESLEEVVETERISEEAREQGGPTYGGPIEEALAGTRELYQNTDYNVYNKLRDTLEKVQSGEYLNQVERNRLYEQQEELKRLSGNPDLIDSKDPYGYVERSKQVVESITNAFQSQTQYKKGDHI